MIGEGLEGAAPLQPAGLAAQEGARRGIGEADPEVVVEAQHADAEEPRQLAQFLVRLRHLLACLIAILEERPGGRLDVLARFAADEARQAIESRCWRKATAHRHGERRGEHEGEARATSGSMGSV